MDTIENDARDLADATDRYYIETGVFTYMTTGDIRAFIERDVVRVAAQLGTTTIERRRAERAARARHHENLAEYLEPPDSAVE